MSNFKIEKDMLPMKGHYFLFNAGTAPLVPYLPTFAKQLGFSTYIVGIIYTFLPIFGLLAKPLFGALGDRFEKHKFIFILFQVLTIGAFTALYFIPDLPKNPSVELSCGDGETFFHTCAKNSTELDHCKVGSLISNNGTAKCQMSCDMSSTAMWQTVCEHWKIPNYCFTEEGNLTFTSFIPKEQIKTEKGCAYLTIDKAKMFDGKEYVPKCKRLAEVSLPCKLFCPDKRVQALFGGIKTGSNDVDLQCSGNGTYYASCEHSEQELQTFAKSFAGENDHIECSSVCKIKKPWELPNICDGWEADDTIQCQPQKPDELPSLISFQGLVPLDKTERVAQCLYFKLAQITTADGAFHYPSCPSHFKNNKTTDHFHSKCRLTCTNDEMNSLFEAPSENQESHLKHYQFWLFFLFMSLNWIGMAVVVSIADAICFEKLGNKAENYGKQRLWGSVGWGVLSLLTGFLIDKFSKDNDNKDYSVAFVLMLIFLSLDVIVSCCLQYKQKKIVVNIFENVGILFSSWQTCHFFLWTILVGMCTGLLWQFLFWLLEDLAKTESCDETVYIKTLQGLVSGIQCFGGEIPFFFISGTILKKIGHLHSMTLILLGFGLRFILYSILTNPWWALPIELFQGLTFGMLFATMNSYASLISPPGIEATVMGLVGAIFEGVGTSLGSFVGGILYGQIGGPATFRIFGCMALVGCLINIMLAFCKSFTKPAVEGTESDSNDEL
ncbi:sugar baby transporter [Arctopsyche grandis]|uniref:sugar baby transporter n=1 Tax=Arctopsyche grandis TaxID=121162 RepID=UPI00406D871E